MKLVDRFARPKARLKLGHRYLGKNLNLTARGYIIFKEWDQTDGKYYYWEEWELTGFNNYDSWVEYDYYSQNITVYEPVRAPEKYDVLNMQKGTSVALTINNLPVNGVVTEVGTGTVVKLRGKMSYQLFPDDVMHYAEVKTGPTTVVSIEDYRQTGDTDYDYYAGRRLNKREQKLMFGKTLTPIKISLKNALYGIFFLSFFVASIFPHYETTCTPRTTTPEITSNSQKLVVGSPTNSTGRAPAVPNSYPQQDCHRVRVYGSGGDGVGK